MLQDEVWLSLVERYVRDVEAAGSNPVTSINFINHRFRCKPAEPSVTADFIVSVLYFISCRKGTPGTMPGPLGKCPITV